MTTVRPVSKEKLESLKDLFEKYIDSGNYYIESSTMKSRRDRTSTQFVIEVPDTNDNLVEDPPPSITSSHGTYRGTFGTIMVGSASGMSFSSISGFTSDEMKGNSKMLVGMKWIDKKSILNEQYVTCPVGLLFVIESRKTLFSNRLENMPRAYFANKNILQDGDIGLWVTSNIINDSITEHHPLFNVPLRITTATRGDEKEGTLRQVYQYVTEDNGLNFYSGITVHSGGGTWSSWPPHDFEKQVLFGPNVHMFKGFSEKFAILTDIPSGWGFWMKDRVPVPFVDQDIIDIPLSSHPIVAGPGIRLAYFWAYQGAPAKDMNK